MCHDPACDSGTPPPPGENWCPRRLDIELIRWLTGWPMKPGTPKINAELLEQGYPQACDKLSR